MSTFDLLAGGFLAFMAVLGMCGLFRKLGRLLWGGATGVVLACLLLAILGIVVRTEWFTTTFKRALPESRIIDGLADGAESLVSCLPSDRSESSYGGSRKMHPEDR